MCVWPFTDAKYNKIFQYIQQAIRHDFSSIEEILTPPEGQDEGVWKYEHLRFVCNFISLIVCERDLCDQVKLLRVCEKHIVIKYINYYRYTVYL